MRVDMWSDVVCPFCWLGRRRLDAAARAEGVEIELIWRAYELDPNRPRVSDLSLVDHIAKKYGLTREQSLASQKQLAEAFAQLGGVYDYERAKPGNTFDAHRLAHLAAEQGLAEAMQERLMRAYFSEGEAIGDASVLRALAEEIGLKPRDVEETLSSDAYAEEVRRDEAIAQQQLRVQGVPFFVFEGRVALSGAQPVETFRQVLRDVQAKIA
jgi:predicted DsbA family dithiol-disulfide isomerase